MGLDNIPATYPCRKQGSVVEVDGKIDCEATIEAGGCPWAIASQGRGTPILGIMGTHCWYRGKSGTYMLQLLIGAGYEPPGGVEGFYGDGQHLSPEHCRALGKWMAEHIEAFAAVVAGRSNDLDAAEQAGFIDEYRYAAWWLTWVADAGDGATAWW